MRKIPFLLSLIAGLIVIIICLYGFFLLRQRPGLPTEIDAKNLIRVDGIEIEQSLDPEFILSQKTIGEPAIFYLKTDGQVEKKEARFAPYYTQALFPSLYLVIGLFCLANAILVFLMRSEDVRARIFYWVSLAFTSLIIIQGGFYCLRKDWLSYLPGVLFYFSYPLAPALLLHFSLHFSKIRPRINKLIIYFPALIFVVLLEGTFIGTGLKSSIEIHRIYQSVMYGFRFYSFLFVSLSIFCLIISYRKTALEEEQAQIKWIFYGLFVGLGPFFLFQVLPQIFKANPLISEELATVFLVFVPLAFAFSIIRFKLMNIELVINRSIVYSILTVFTVSVYLFSVLLLQNIFAKFFSTRETIISVFGALVAAVAFHPARKKIQDFVDRAFFRMSYDYKKSILSFNEKAHKMVSRDHLTDFFLSKINKTLPLEYLGILVYAIQSGRHKLLIRKNGEKTLEALSSLTFKQDKIYARKSAVRTEESMDFSKEKILEEKNLEIVIPLSFRSTDLDGLLTIGKKKSGERFTRDDLELLLTMANELALNLERIKLQEEVFEERTEKEKLDELNRLKTEFISSVSHELRTPMSSIRGLAEILQAGKIKDKTKREEILNLVASESGRLSRFLHNILDFGKIEHQVKTYDFKKTKIQPIIKEVVKFTQYRLESEGFRLRTRLIKKPLFLKIDEDAVKQALTNLLDNAIKYSSDTREIMIELLERKKEMEIQVQDKGIGIPPEAQEKIFEGFYRHPEARDSNPKGVGLGLKIVKHIMEAHQGQVRVKSQPNEGSTFSLIFPKP
ncbi:MAG: GHKL domain-containing protein [Candidatus Aminicenantes bacterium]|nr:GHKL domain-containing protein [Candidatus Aminicenantes bacterium]